MTTPNQKLFDEFVERAIDVFHMSETEARALAREFSDNMDQSTLAALIALFLEDDDPYLRRRAVARILAQRVDALERVKERMYYILERLVRDEAEFVSATVGPVQDELPGDEIFAAAFIATMFNRVMHKPISGWDARFDDLFKELIARDRARLEKTFSRALQQKRSVSWLAKALRADFEDTAETINIVLHSTVQHARSVVTDLAMAMVGGSVRWVSILDGRTTAVCRSRSGKIYPAGSGPRPPAHVRCRSTVVPYLPGRGDYEEPTYAEWLKRQTPERVRQILGKTKGAKFLEGTLSLDDMVTTKGRELTLKDLAAKRKAGT